MSLETYRRKRDFGRTPEPDGNAGPTPPPTGDRRFVVQRHRATRLHYDFRLEIDGVLMSWAVPKGPSLNPQERRMAVHVEDHPLSYFDFEGVIPKGEYGGGDVIVWDWGTFEPEETDDPGRAVRKGELKFSLDGEKLRGRFTLVKTRSANADEDSWLLIHKSDEHADRDWDVNDHPRSVKSGRTNDEVLTGMPALWDSNAPAAQAEIDLSTAREAPMPDFIEPMKATAVDRAFSDEDWLFELKLDGYRVEAVVEGGRARLWTRNKQDAATYFPDLADLAPTWIRADNAILDGEVVALDEAGKPSFALLQERAGPLRGRTPNPAAAPIAYYVFDLLYLDGRSLLDVPLEHRKRLLKSVLRDHAVVRFATHVDEDGESFLEFVRGHRLEGMVAKLRSSRYEPGRRSRYWLKVKVRREQEVVVVGYETGKGNARDLGSLLVAVRDGDGYRFIGEVGSGLDGKSRRYFRDELEAHLADKPPVDNPPKIRGARWSSPRLVIRIEFTDWTADKLLRQPSYKGLEVGREPGDVRLEEEQPARKLADAAEASAGRTAAKATRAARKAGQSAVTGRSGTKAAESGTKAEGVSLPALFRGQREPKGASDSGSTASTAAARPNPRSARAESSEGRPTAEATRAPKGASSPSRNAGSDKRGGKTQARASNAAGGAIDLRRSLADPPLVDELPQAATPDELQALDEMKKEGTWRIGGREVRLTNLDKVLFPKTGFTKRDLIRYYVTIAPLMLPYLRGRAINLSRWPDGVTGHSFWQKEIPKYAPEWMARWRYPDAKPSESHTYIVADQVATMAWLANHATIDIHPWTSRTESHRQPDYALVDIDPGPDTSWDEVIALTRVYRTAFEHLGVTALPKVTGKRGIQVWVPVRAGYSYDETRDWVEGLSRAVGGALPDLVSWEWEKSARGGKARLDFTQNAVNKTLVAPYAVRPVEGAAVSTPISWDEVDDPDLRPDRWNIRTIPDRVAQHGDLFAPALEAEQELPPIG
jgi:DNA ligase D-like protein (predicted ligase)/DNA ligase D-like protein (predicted polymerase)/DNA ligase D-like protein (predicted 3'-phosphoesterase)